MAQVVREITFKQSGGHSRTGEYVTFQQDEILLNGRRIGYVGYGEGEAANLIAPTDEGTRQAISEAIAAKRGSAPKRINTAPQIGDVDLSEDNDD